MEDPDPNPDPEPDDELTREEFAHVRFVPLIGDEGWTPSDDS